jgi:hypothetical protein
MYDAGKVITGLIIFVLLVTSPIWYNLVGKAAPMKDPVLPKEYKECVLPADEMRAKHMTLLNDWRDDALRRGDRTEFEVDGKKYRKSLQNTCMACHTSKKEFCDRCHDYTSVTPYCWDCHLAPVE